MIYDLEIFATLMCVLIAIRFFLIAPIADSIDALTSAVREKSSSDKTTDSESGIGDITVALDGIREAIDQNRKKFPYQDVYGDE